MVMSGTNAINIEGVETVVVGSSVTRDRTLDPTCTPGAVTGAVNRRGVLCASWFGW
jgi:hypothetical protein